MITERDLQELDSAARLIVGIIERHRVREENAAERRAQFKLFDNTKRTHSQSKIALEEINAMLVELKIKLKARQRENGLFEIRPTFKGKRVSIYGYTAEEIARKYRDFLKNKVSSAVQPNGDKLFAWFDEWLEVYKKPNIAKNSFDNIVRCIDKHIKPHLSDKQLTRYNVTELTAALNKIESTRMRKYARGILRDAFSVAVAAGKIRLSPAQNLLSVKHVTQKGKALPLNDLRDMIDSSAGQLERKSFLYFLFCLFAGTRRDEARGITLNDCDFKNKIVYIHGTKTIGSNRRLPMFPILEKIIHAAEQLGGKGGQLFNITQHRADDDFKTFRGKNEQAVLHWLRHTFGTIQICVFAIPANTVALWLGHSDASTTIKNYTHPEDLAPDIYFSGEHSESEKIEILKARYNEIISTVENLL